MGFSDFGQSLLAITVFVVAMLVTFGGFGNQSLFEGYFPNGVNSPHDINNSASGITVTTTATPFATPTGINPAQDNNPWLNLVFGSFNNAINLVSKITSSLTDAITYVGIPMEIIYVLLVPFSIFVSLYLIYFISQIASGLTGRGS